MIQKIKDLMKVKSLVDDNIKEVKEEKKEIAKLKKDITETRDATKKAIETISRLEKRQNEFLDKLDKNLQSIENSRNNFEEQIKDFKLQKTNMERKMFEKSDGELNKHLERIKTDVNSYNELKREMTAINNTVVKLDEEIKKFLEISKNIKAKDYSLERYAKELSKRDNEKLELMKKIDALERLIGRERRRKF